MIYVAEFIYLKISEIKKNNPNITNIVAIEMFIGSESYNEISTGKFHDNLFKKIRNNRLKNLETGQKIPKETIELLKFQKTKIMKDLGGNTDTYFAKSSFPLSNSQNAFSLLWRMCESYELWCNEIGKKVINSLKILS